jgi:hypothetical protein
MDYQRREVMAAQAKQRTETTARADTAMLQTIQQAALAAETVTGDPAWDRMLSFMQAALEDARKAHSAATAALLDPRLVGHDAMLLVKLNVAVAAERIRTLEAVIALPAELKADGKKAALKLEKLDVDGKAAA